MKILHSNTGGVRNWKENLSKYMLQNQANLLEAQEWVDVQPWNDTCKVCPGLLGGFAYLISLWLSLWFLCDLVHNRLDCNHTDSTCYSWQRKRSKIPIFLDLIPVSAHMLLSVLFFRRLTFSLDQSSDSVFTEDRRNLPAQPNRLWNLSEWWEEVGETIS